MKRTIVGICLLSAVALTGCYDSHAQQSAIVREVEAAGSGNLDEATIPGLTVFFGSHQGLAGKVSAQCAPLVSQADAHWTETAEGKICRVAPVFAPRTNWTSDQRSF